MELTRKQVIEELKAILEIYWNVPLSKTALEYAISSLEADEAYQIMYEGGEIFTKADMVATLNELKYDLYHGLCKEIHDKEDCPCTNQTTSCLATFRVCDANSAIYKVIQQKIDKLRGEESGNGD